MWEEPSLYSLLQLMSEKCELDTQKENKIKFITIGSAFNNWHDLDST